MNKVKFRCQFYSKYAHKTRCNTTNPVSGIICAVIFLMIEVLLKEENRRIFCFRLFMWWFVDCGNDFLYIILHIA